eukprot:CAMPEP_0175076318 /NCGR_PEP_ID=MMETSP0052_2-20121109/22644_1 /TAXON_ID=51329 ORGANISM="Polytomella parva, Strain SAG 63-3" /NCGR_SAMPLE_ID=MMETSP0052_2 /ASSEMBLY_ACC=CAM_ASM_000194 /LENGTH=96 /DNA_ID=CAMNT_0016345411 /DNA_START=185 /DNA_END=471 /DNA_ORIENTATION=+
MNQPPLSEEDLLIPSVNLTDPHSSYVGGGLNAAGGPQWGRRAANFGAQGIGSRSFSDGVPFQLPMDFAGGGVLNGVGGMGGGIRHNYPGEQRDYFP